MQRLNTRLTITQILRWADRHHDLTGRWPNRFSKSVAGLDMGDERWSAIEGALFGGSRGLPGKLTLARLLAKHRGVRSRGDLPKLHVD